MWGVCVCVGGVGTERRRVRMGGRGVERGGALCVQPLRGRAGPPFFVGHGSRDTSAQGLVRHFSWAPQPLSGPVHARAGRGRASGRWGSDSANKKMQVAWLAHDHVSPPLFPTRPPPPPCSHTVRPPPPHHHHHTHPQPSHLFVCLFHDEGGGHERHRQAGPDGGGRPAARPPARRRRGSQHLPFFKGGARLSGGGWGDGCGGSLGREGRHPSAGLGVGRVRVRGRDRPC